MSRNSTMPRDCQTPSAASTCQLHHFSGSGRQAASQHSALQQGALQALPACPHTAPPSSLCGALQTPCAMRSVPGGAADLVMPCMGAQQGVLDKCSNRAGQSSWQSSEASCCSGSSAKTPAALACGATWAGPPMLTMGARAACRQRHPPASCIPFGHTDAWLRIRDPDQGKCHAGPAALGSAMVACVPRLAWNCACCTPVGFQR